MQLKVDVGDEWVAKTFPPEPLHTNLLGPVNDALYKLKEHYDEEMELFYRNHCLNKTGEGPGGKFNGPSIKIVLKNLKNLEDILPSEGFPFIEYLQSIKEVHNMCIAEVFDDNSELAVVLKKNVIFFGPLGFLAKSWTTGKNRIEVQGGGRGWKGPWVSKDCIRGCITHT